MLQNNPQSLFNKLEFLKKLNFNNILDGTQKTLNVINQAIPIFNQVKPLINNTKTLFKLTQIINEPEKQEVKVPLQSKTQNTSNIINIQNEETKKELRTNPIFYI